MGTLFAQAVPDPRLNFWNGVNDSSSLWWKIGIAFALGVLLVFVLLRTPPAMRKFVVGGATFIAGFVYIISWLWPAPIARVPGTQPNGPVESVGFFIADTVGVVGDFYNILAGLLLGLGVYSILRIHLRKCVKRQHDWGFSVVLLLGIVAMIAFGYVDWHSRQGPGASALESMSNWSFWNYGGDFLFDGLLQQMDAAMFSLIAFFILSAAYRAFRVRSVEATILLVAALIMIISLMGAFVYIWDTKMIGALTNHDAGSFLNNFQLSVMSKWLQDNLQTSSLRGVDFGVGIGLLAMAMRLWLSLEKGGISQ